MSLRDVEVDVALLLEAAGLGSTTSTPPTLYAGPYPATAPDAFIACRQSGSERPEKYLANTGLVLHRETVTVLVRGTREPGSYVTDGARARAAWSALCDLHPDAYVRVDPEDGSPTYLGDDDEHRPRWSFTVGLEYLSATAPGVVVPLSRDASLQVAGLSVTGETRLGGSLVLASLPFASFPPPDPLRGALVFDTDAGLLRVSTGTAWVALGTPPPVPSAAEVPVTPLGALSSNTVQAALEELQADVSSRATSGELLVISNQLVLKADTAAVTAALALKADAAAVATSLAAKADAAALASHTLASAAHGVTGVLVGTTDTQTLSNKKHSGLLEVVDVPSGSVAFRIPAGSYLALNTTGDRYLYLNNGVLQSNTSWAAPSITAGQGIGNDSAAYAVAGTTNWVINRNGRLKRLSGDTTATPGNATSNTWMGRAKVAAGQSSVTITNNLCLATSQVRAHAQQASADSTGATVVRTSAVAGALTIYLNTAPAAALEVAWELLDI